MPTGLDTEAAPSRTATPTSLSRCRCCSSAAPGRSGTHVVSKILNKHSHFRKVPNEARFHTDPGGFPDVLAGPDRPRPLRLPPRHYWYRNFEPDPAQLPRPPPLRPEAPARGGDDLLPAPLRQRRAGGRLPAALLRPALAARHRGGEGRPDRAELRHRRRGRAAGDAVPRGALHPRRPRRPRRRRLPGRPGPLARLPADDAAGPRVVGGADPPDRRRRPRRRPRARLRGQPRRPRLRQPPPRHLPEMRAVRRARQREARCSATSSAGSRSATPTPSAGARRFPSAARTRSTPATSEILDRLEADGVHCVAAAAPGPAAGGRHDRPRRRAARATPSSSSSAAPAAPAPTCSRSCSATTPATRGCRSRPASTSTRRASPTCSPARSPRSSSCAS